MGQLSELPNELLAQIIELVPLDDIESLSLTSRHIHATAATALQLHRKRKHYAIVSNVIEPEAAKRIQPDGVVADLLCTILQNPDIGHYIKKLHLKELRSTSKLLGTKKQENSISGAQSNDHVPYPLKMSLLRDAVVNRNDICLNLTESWETVLGKGDEAALAAMLLYYVPDLREIWITSDQGCWLETVIMDMSRSHHLTELKSVHLTRFGGRECLGLIRAFMTLPSVATIHVHGYPIESLHNSLVPRRPRRPSQVKEFIFGGSHIDDSVLSRLLESVESLEAFSLEDVRFYGPPLAIATLLNKYRNTLKSLKLGWGSRRPFGSLFNFKVLTDIDINASLLCDFTGSNVEYLPDLLPASIEKLKIRFSHAPCPNMVSVYKIRKFLLTIIRASRCKLSHLKDIHVRVPETEQGRHIVETLKEVTRGQRRALRARSIWIDIEQGTFTCSCRGRHKFKAWRMTKFGLDPTVPAPLQPVDFDLQRFDPQAVHQPTASPNFVTKTL